MRRDDYEDEDQDDDEAQEQDQDYLECVYENV